jgi:DNA-directed RNA polymerase subunit E'/Rpb7
MVELMDPLYERRELVRNISVPSKHVRRAIQTSLLSQLKMTVEGRCGSEGYIAKDSLQILNYSLGRVSTLNEGVEYRVKFQADVCLPHPGQKFKAPVAFRSKIGLHCELDPLKILLPRDLHLGNTDFEQTSEKDEIEIEIIGSQFQQDDKYIYVLGKFLRRIPVVTLEAAPTTVAEEPKPEEATGDQVGLSAPPSTETKSVSITAPTAATSSAGPVRRRRRLVPSGTSEGTLQINVGSTTEGETKGTN